MDTAPPNKALHRTRRDRSGSGVTTSGSCLRAAPGAGAPVSAKMLGRPNWRFLVHLAFAFILGALATSCERGGQADIVDSGAGTDLMDLAVAAPNDISSVGHDMDSPVADLAFDASSGDIARGSVKCGSLTCVFGEACVELSRPHDAAADPPDAKFPVFDNFYGCFKVPAQCANAPTCDCVKHNGFDPCQGDPCEPGSTDPGGMADIYCAWL